MDSQALINSFPECNFDGCCEAGREEVGGQVGRHGQQLVRATGRQLYAVSKCICVYICITQDSFLKNRGFVIFRFLKNSENLFHRTVHIGKRGSTNI